MSRFTDYAAKMKQQVTPFTPGQPLSLMPQQPTAQQILQPQQTFEKPADGNYIGLVNDMLGPTPAEREAQERRLAENKAKMNGWLGLFQGLGALGDLYYAGKGVNPSQPNNQPQQLLNQHYAEEQQRLDNLYKNRQAYANMLYNIKRQAGDDARKDKLADAQSKWYDTREEMARMKNELDKMKAVRVIKQKDGSLMKFDPVSGTIEPLTEADPLYAPYMQSIINRNNRANMGKGSGGSRGGANNGTYGYETLVTEGIDEKGNRWKKTTRVPTTGGKPESRSQVIARTEGRNKTNNRPQPRNNSANSGNKTGGSGNKNSKSGKKKVNW